MKKFNTQNSIFLMTFLLKKWFHSKKEKICRTESGFNDFFRIRNIDKSSCILCPNLMNQAASQIPQKPVSIKRRIKS